MGELVRFVEEPQRFLSVKMWAFQKPSVILESLEPACGNLKSNTGSQEKKTSTSTGTCFNRVSGHQFFCVSLREHQACEETTVEYNGIRYVCYFTERTYGSISAVLKANRCTLVCKQWGRVDMVDSKVKRFPTSPKDSDT